jgi:hypothetical protein
VFRIGEEKVDRPQISRENNALYCLMRNSNRRNKDDKNTSNEEWKNRIWLSPAKDLSIYDFITPEIQLIEAIV